MNELPGIWGRAPGPVKPAEGNGAEKLGPSVARGGAV